ncbi:MAG: MFS transporter, partial [Parachlamydiaceae bacterium]
MNNPYSYGIKIAIIYSLVWFIDLLDASTLNVAIHSIAESFHIESIQAEWALIGFLLAMTLGIGLSSWLANRFGMKKVFILSQVFYLLSSIGCAFAFNIEALILFRIIQGLAAGMAIPLGMSSLMKALPQAKWAKTSAYMNMVTLIAPALGPIFGAYVTLELG